jgi:hypothetical protein
LKRIALCIALAAWPALARADVLIDEVLPDPLGVDSGLEWIEVVNTGAVGVNLVGWEIQRSTTGAYFVKYTFPVVTILPGEHLVVGEELVADADFNLAPGAYFSFGNALSSGDAVHLCDNFGAVVDTVVYGPNNTDGFLDDGGALAVPAPGPLEDQSIARLPDGADSDDSSLDFAIDDTPTPGLDNATLPPLTVTAAAPGLAGQVNTWDLENGPPSAKVAFLWGTAAGLAPLPGGACPGVDAGILSPRKLGSAVADPSGYAQLAASIPVNAAGKTMLVQALDVAACRVSNVSATAFP